MLGTLTVISAVANELLLVSISILLAIGWLAVAVPRFFTVAENVTLLPAIGDAGDAVGPAEIERSGCVTINVPEFPVVPVHLPPSSQAKT